MLLCCNISIPPRSRTTTSKIR